MIWKPKSIPTFDSGTGKWTETRFETQKEFSKYLDSQFKLPGQYNLKDTHVWRERALHFQEHKKYTLLDENSVEYKSFFKEEKRKIGVGAIFDGFYVPGAFYDYLNYAPIVDKIKGTEDFPDLWDSDYHWYLYVERAKHQNLNAGTVKARQKGVSLKETRRLLRNLWFLKMSSNKMVGYEEDHVNEKGSWKFLVGYRNFMNEHTPWYRHFEPDESLHWEQKKTVYEGLLETKKTFQGLRSKLIAATSKKNPAKAVGGHITLLLCEEAGIAPNLDKVITFAEAATKMGGITTGMIIVVGAVGELKDCAPLEKIAFKPKAHGFLGVEDTFSDVPGEEILFFWPDYWNYIYLDEDNNIVKCYDKDGNSDIEKAKEVLLKEEENQKKKDDYVLWKSQHPWNLQDAFAIREDNIWPTRIIKDHQNFIRQTYDPLCVELEEDNGKIFHKISNLKPISSLRVDPTKDNRGVIEIDELPLDNPEWGLYYAGVDPIRQTNTTTSKSLMSVTIFKAAHMRDGKLVNDYPVARYTGRYPSWEKTYQTCMDLLRFYNARTAVESNVTGFHEWAIGKGYGHYFLHRKEIHILNELVPNSSIVNEIGVRMEGVFKEKALEFGVAYVDEILSSYEKNEEKHYIYGVSRLRDIMLMEEMLKFSKDLNTDRLVSFLLALIAARSNTNRHVISSERNPNTQKEVLVKMSLPGQFDRKSVSFKNSFKPTNHFTKRKH
jgi:hypothetical protein